MTVSQYVFLCIKNIPMIRLCLFFIGSLIIPKRNIFGVWISLFDWVTKVKRNIARFRSVNPSMLIAQIYSKLLTVEKPKECVSVSIPDVYIKLPVLAKTKK